MSPITPERIQKLKESLKKTPEKRTGFKKPSSFKSRLTKTFVNHPLYVQQRSSSSSLSSQPSTSATTRPSSPSPTLEEVMEWATVMMISDLVTPLDIIPRVEFRKMKPLTEYLFVAKNGDHVFLFQLSDRYVEVRLPESCPPPPAEILDTQRLYFARRDGRVRWVLKNKD